VLCEKGFILATKKTQTIIWLYKTLQTKQKSFVVFDSSIDGN
jgi:hypothetical protein